MRKVLCAGLALVVAACSEAEPFHYLASGTYRVSEVLDAPQDDCGMHPPFLTPGAPIGVQVTGDPRAWTRTVAFDLVADPDPATWLVGVFNGPTMGGGAFRKFEKTSGACVLEVLHGMTAEIVAERVLQLNGGHSVRRAPGSPDCTAEELAAAGLAAGLPCSAGYSLTARLP